MENDSTPQTTPQAKLQATVDYLTGITIASAQDAILEWTADDRLKLFKMDFSTGKATEVVFDVPISEVTNVGGSMIMLSPLIGDKKYNLQFSRTAIAKMGAGGVVGAVLAVGETKASTINTWIAAFKAQNIPMKGYKGWAWAWKWALIVTGIILVITIVYAVIQVQSDNSTL